MHAENALDTLAVLSVLLLASLSTCADELVLDHPPVGFSAPERPGLVDVAVPWGAIEVVPHDGRAVLASARVSGVGDPAAAAEQGTLLGRSSLRVQEAGNVVSVRVPVSVDGFYGVELRVEVPRNVDLKLSMERGGEIRVRDVAGRIEIENRNGSVELVGISGAAAVYARNGSITARFARVRPAEPMSFVSLNGTVDVTFPDDLAATVRARTQNGDLESEFEFARAPVQPSPSAAWVARPELAAKAPKAWSGEIGGGGPDFHFYSANGSVILRRGRGS